MKLKQLKQTLPENEAKLFDNVKALNHFFSQTPSDEDEIPRQFRSTPKSEGARSKTRGFS